MSSEQKSIEKPKDCKTILHDLMNQKGDGKFASVKHAFDGNLVASGSFVESTGKDTRKPNRRDDDFVAAVCSNQDTMVKTDRSGSEFSNDADLGPKLTADGKTSTKVRDQRLESGTAGVSGNGSPPDEEFDDWALKILEEVFGNDGDIQTPIDDVFPAPVSNDSKLEQKSRRESTGNDLNYQYNPCVCGTQHDTNNVLTFAIMCDFCGDWCKVAIDCVGFDANQANSMPNWFCHCCDYEEHEEHKEHIELMRQDMGSFDTNDLS